MVEASLKVLTEYCLTLEKEQAKLAKMLHFQAAELDDLLVALRQDLPEICRVIDEMRRYISKQHSTHV